MAAASWAGSRKFTGVLLASTLLCACGGGDLHSSNLLSGTAATGAPLVGATVRLRCVGGSMFQTSTNVSGLWQITVTGQPLPCAVQASEGSVNDLPNTTIYHSVALSFGVTNITPLTDLVLARMLGAAPQAWFDRPDFAQVSNATVQSALDAVSAGLGLTKALRQANPLTAPFVADSNDYLDVVLSAMASTLAKPAVNKRYSDLLDAAIAADFSAVASFAPTFATEYVRPGND